MEAFVKRYRIFDRLTKIGVDQDSNMNFIPKILFRIVLRVVNFEAIDSQKWLLGSEDTARKV